MAGLREKLGRDVYSWFLRARRRLFQDTTEVMRKGTNEHGVFGVHQWMRSHGTQGTVERPEEQGEVQAGQQNDQGECCG